MRYIVLLLICGSALAHFFVLLWQERFADQQYFAAQQDLAVLYPFLETETTLSQAIGALKLLGLSGRTIKEQALGILPDNDSETLKRLSVIQQLYHVDGVYVLDKTGKIVAHQTQGKSSLGTSVPWRPYFQQAMKGIANVYPAVGSSSGERGLYLAVPIYETTRIESQIIGVLMLKKPIHPIDERLNRTINGITAWLSPQGVVFSSNQKEWLFQVIPPTGDADLASIVQHKQFGSVFDQNQGKPKQLPFFWEGIDIQRVTYQEKEYVIVGHQLDLSDVLGKWTLIMMRPAHFILTTAQYVLIYLGIPLLVLLLGLLIRWQRQALNIKKLAEKRAHEAESRTALLVESVDDGIMGMNNQGNIIFANHAAMALLGLEQSEVMGVSLSLLLCVSPDHEKAQCGITDALHHGKRYYAQHAYLRADGVSILLEVQLLPSKNMDGWDGFVLVFRDISEQQRVQLQLHTQMNQLIQAKQEIEQSHQRTKDSINYAALIQYALMPDEALFSQAFRDYFTLWLPKDIVGGDVYFFTRLRQGDDWLLMVIDCTGHGVPGAFVTMLVKAVEQQIVTNIQLSQAPICPADILSLFNRTIKFLLKQDHNDSMSNAGFDGAIVYYQAQAQKLIFSGANTPLYHISHGQLRIIKGDRQSIGYKNSDAAYCFAEHSISVSPLDCIYLTTDGFTDQNGGAKDFPLGKSRFSKLLLAHYDKPMSLQKQYLTDALTDYQGSAPRNDDITVIGFRI